MIMKRNYTLMLFLLATVSILAQAPEKMSYQAVLRDASNTLLSNQEVGMQISILQSTISGIAVYTETQTATTNTNGLVSIAIGAGTSSSDFSAIDWSTGPYFIKTATDPSGGSSYTITGTSQIMSVPFAMYAKTSGSAETNATNIDNNKADIAANIIAISANTDKIGITSEQAAAISANTINVSWSNDGQGNITNTNSGSIDINSDLNVSGNVRATSQPVSADDLTRKDYVDAGNAANVAIIAALEARIAAIELLTPATVGDFRTGGIVFWVDPTDNTHGLVCAIEDQSADIQSYNNGNYTKTGASATAIGTGSANTTAIIASQGAVETAYAAGLARAYNGGGFTDWFLPSKDELNQMYQNRATINSTARANSGTNFRSDYYWSSSEDGNINTWLYNFVDGTQGSANKNGANSMRAVRAF
jgi:hypothetical protein